MPDVAIGALIGLGGSIIVAVVSYGMARLQVNARHAEFIENLKHQREESKATRLIESRKGYLIPLREIISRWMTTAHNGISAVGRVQAIEREKPVRVLERNQEIEYLNKVLEEGFEISSELEILRGQSSDLILDGLISEVQKSQKEQGIRMLSLTRLFNESKDVSMNVLEKAAKENEDILKQLRAKLIETNKRIEQLLVGEQAT